MYNPRLKDKKALVDLARYGTEARKSIHPDVLIGEHCVKCPPFREGDILDANATVNLIGDTLNSCEVFQTFDEEGQRIAERLDNLEQTQSENYTELSDKVDSLTETHEQDITRLDDKTDNLALNIINQERVVDISKLSEVGGKTSYLVTKQDGSHDTIIVAKGDKGDQGESFSYEDFTPEQLEALKVKGDKGDKGTSITRVQQTTVAYTDRGVNVVTIDLDDGSSSLIQIRNGSGADTIEQDLQAEVARATSAENALLNNINSVSSRVDHIVEDAPEALDTLLEISEKLHDEEDAVAALTLEISLKYTKPATGIPSSDMSESVRTSLSKADTALLEHLDISGKADLADLAIVATTGEYNDLLNKPVIPIVPTNVSAFTNDAGYLTEHQDISGKQDVISDLDTIRSGAQAGSTALQPSALNSYYNKDQVDTKLSSKQDTISNLATIEAGAAKGATSLQPSDKGVANGVATLNENGVIPSSQLPSYVDDVLEYESNAEFPITGESGKIYVDLLTNKTYRWGGSDYVEISESLALGETSSTAYAGNKGKATTDAFNAHAANTDIHVTAAKQAAWDAKSDFSGSYNDLVDKPTTLNGYGITDAYTKTEVNGLVDTPHQEYVTVDAYANLPATGSKDTIYRVANYNGSTSQVDASVYSEYAWNGTQYIFLCVKSQIGEVFDISVYNNNAKYADLAAALNGGANIPQSLQKGGMSVKFETYDNKYVQYRLMSDSFSTTPSNWQNIDVHSDIFYLGTSVSSIRDFSIVEHVRPGSSGEYINSGSDSNRCYYIPVTKGQFILYSATNNVGKTIVFCFSQQIPVIGGLCTDYDERFNTVEITEYFAAPYDGYFIAYHNHAYFKDQIFRISDVNTQLDAANARLDSVNTELFDFEEQYEQNSTIFSDILNSPDTENNFGISYSKDTYTATADYVASAVWHLNAGDEIKVVDKADGNETMFYLLNSVNYVEGATPDYIEGTHKWRISNGKSVKVKITQDCYLFVSIRSTSNPDYWWKPSFLGKKELLTAEEINARLNDAETSYTVTRNIELQGGNLNNNGNVKKVTASRGEYMNYLNTPMFINAVEIKSISVEQEEAVTFYCYTTDFSYIGQTSNLSLLDNTKWVKIKLEKQTEYAGTKSLNVTYVTNGLEDAKNTRASLTRFTFSYEIQSPVFDEVVSSELPNIDNVRHFDNGMLILPPNYSNTGAPVRLVIFAHGTGGFSWTSTGSYSGLLEFVAKNGYAVCDCCGMSDKYSIGNLTPPISDARHNLMSISCYCNLYKFLIKNYNLMEDGCFMFGKSNGGIATTFMSLAQPIPIIASAGLAPSISIIESLRYTRGGSLQYWTDRLGLDIDCSNVATQTYLYSVESSNQSIVNYLKANANVFSRIDPFIMQTDIDANQIATAFFAHGYLEANQEVEQIISNSKKWQTCPMKIFHALDDQSVPYQISKWYVEMCKKTNSPCFLRTIPEGLGGHHAVDTNSNAPKVSFTTKFGETVQIVVSYAELVEWFNRW